MFLYMLRASRSLLRQVFLWGPGGICSLLGRLGLSWGALGRSWCGLEPVLGGLGRSWRVLGAVLGGLGSVMGLSRGAFGRSWGILGWSWGGSGATAGGKNNDFPIVFQ